MPIVIGVLNGQSLKTRLPDDSIVVGGFGRPLERPAEYLVGPDDKTLLPIVQVNKPALLMPGDTLVAMPESTQPMDAKIEMRCPVCGGREKKVMEGWVVWSPPWLPNIVVQCPNCHMYLWVESPQIRKIVEQIGLNRPKVNIIEE